MRFQINQGTAFRGIDRGKYPELKADKVLGVEISAVAISRLRQILEAAMRKEWNREDFRAWFQWVLENTGSFWLSGSGLPSRADGRTVFRESRRM